MALLRKEDLYSEFHGIVCEVQTRILNVTAMLEVVLTHWEGDDTVRMDKCNDG